MAGAVAGAVVVDPAAIHESCSHVNTHKARDAGACLAGVDSWTQYGRSRVQLGSLIATTGSIESYHRLERSVAGSTNGSMKRLSPEKSFALLHVRLIGNAEKKFIGAQEKMKAMSTTLERRAREFSEQQNFLEMCRVWCLHCVLYMFCVLALAVCGFGCLLICSAPWFALGHRVCN